ncbi:MAG: hypothetical protein RIR70_638 [Pseudomonadota bacterium]|jgi:TPR repeat protein
MHTIKWVLLLLIGWSANAVSGPIEDALAAYKQGDTEKLVELLVDKDTPDFAGVSRIQSAAQQGKAEAQGLLGIFYLTGYGVPEDRKKYFSWMRKAAENGSAPAQVSLGSGYQRGDKDDGIAKDYQKAYYWYRKAADQGYAPAQDSLGGMYKRGDGVPKNDGAAVFWYRKAADQGYASAQASLGEMYKEGRGVPKNDREAVFWYRKAADQGHAPSQIDLGTMYKEGHGIPKNDQEAYFWYRKAADQGYMAASEFLSLLLRDLGNYQEAYFWKLLSNAQMSSIGLDWLQKMNRQTLEDLERKLTPEQRAAAQAQARDWKPTPTTRP